MCQVRRHASIESAWLVAGGYVYDVTEYLATAAHPGGDMSILRKCGGKVDCSQDLQFHSPKGKQLWKRYKIGKVIPCGAKAGQQGSQWWMFWK
jgi:nitrate reductase (NAD(P)H)